MFRAIMATAFAAMLAVPAGAATELLTNGGFETGDFTGWTASVFASSNGTVEVTSGSAAPVSGLSVVGPSEGSHHVLTGQSGPGAYSVMQGFTVPGSPGDLLLSFDIFAATDADLFDNGLDPFCCGATQHTRVDILAAGSGAFELGPAVVHTVLAPFIDGSFGVPYRSVLADLTGILAPGGSYLLRFAQTDNAGFFTMGVDNVSLTASPVPLPAAGLLLAGSLGLFGGLRLVRRAV